jgi:branched-chain amino acid aminotransferase
MAEPIVYLNGDWVPASEARISVFDRGFLFGDGVFETGRLHRARYFRLEQHLARLERSSSFFRLPVPPLDQLLSIAQGLAERNAFDEGSLRITVTRGSGGRGLSRAGAGPNTVVATLSRVPDDWETRAARGWRIRTSSVRRPPTESTPPQLKGLGRPYALLAHYEAEDDGLDDALLLSADGLIAEGPTWNLFWRNGQTVFTPALSAGILEGVTRGIIIDLVRAAGYHVEEGCWQRPVLDSADEVFATMTSNGVVPITQLDQRSLHQRTLAASLQTEYWKLVRSELGQKE